MSTEESNVRRWAADARGCYEVWYLTWNDPRTDQGFWLRFTTEHPDHGPPHGELWFARFDPARPERTFGVHRVFHDVTATGAPFALGIGGAELHHDRTRGTLEAAGHRIEWDLRWDPGHRVLRLLPDVMYARGGLGETTVESPNPRVAASGRLVVDGETIAFDRTTLGQTHLWGKKHAFSWIWGRCAEFEGAPGALLEVLAVRLQRYGRTLPPMTLVTLDVDGERFHLNQFRHVAGNRGSWQTGHATLSAWSPTVRIEVELSCTPEQLINAPYVDPDGTRLWCANTEVGDARVTVYRRARLRWHPYRTLVAVRRAHFETGTRERDPVVVREHVRVT
jgi:hypothetical protein